VKTIIKRVGNDKDKFDSQTYDNDLKYIQNVKWN